MTKKLKHPTYEEVAELVENTHEEVLNTQGMIRDVEKNLTGKMAESEDRLLSAIRGIEVRREDFDSLKEDVHDLARRVARLEKH